MASFTLIELLVVVAIVMLLAALLLPALKRARETGQLVGCTSNLRQQYLAAASYGNDNIDYPPMWDDETAAWSRVGAGYAITWPYLMMPYLGYTGSAAKFVADPQHHGSLEIRRYGANLCYKALADGDTKTTKAGVFWCPATRGNITHWYGTTGGPFGGWGDVIIDYGINSYVTGGITASNEWHAAFPNHIKFGDSTRTSPAKLVFLGDAYGYFYRLYYTPSNRHYARSDTDNESGRSNCALFDGHVENFKFDVWPGPELIVAGDEASKPGRRFYVNP